jgi:hypothetical protein
LGFPTGWSFTSSTARQQVFWHHHHRAINKFSGAVAGEKEDFCKGSFTRTSFTLFLVLLLLYFYLHRFIKNPKKLVSFIVVISLL